MSSTPTSTNIRYIVLSDLHFGQDRSILTAVDPDSEEPTTSTEPALQALMSCLRHLVRQNVPKENGEKDRPTLILLGDILEQAFTDIDVTGPIFQGFVELWRGEDDQRSIFDKVVFIAGNHDHNMWELTRAYHYWKSLDEWTEAALQASPATLPASIKHATELRKPLNGDKDLVGLLINRQLATNPPLPVEIYYPTFALGSESGKRAVLFNHGHYFEPLYQLMSTLLTYVSPEPDSSTTPTPPTMPTAEDIEHTNFAWLDFFWSMLGRQGPAGKEVERLYDSMASPAALEGVVKRVLKRLIKNYVTHPEHLFWQTLTAVVAKLAVEVLRPELETISSSQEPLSHGTIKTMRAYVEGPLRRQIDSDDGGLSHADDLTLVFGHTHKPFQSQKDEVYPIKVYNTGGWVIDPLVEDNQPLRGGSCLLLNEQLDITSVHFYRQLEGEKYKVNAQSLDESTDFHKFIARVIKEDHEKLFEKFSEVVAFGVRLRLGLEPGL